MSDRSIPLRWLLLILIAESGYASAKRVTLNLPLPPTPNTPRPLPLKIQKFISVSEAHYDHDHHKHHQEETPEPHFAPVNATRRVFLGATANLHCTVHDLGNESVSWMRRDGDELRLLTWDVHTYADDDRYSLVHETGDRWQRWQLVIRDTQVQDGGQYRCQVTTAPPLALDIVLQVTEPRSRIVDERGEDVLEKHYNSGSMIELKCIIDRVPFPHLPVTWRRGAVTLVFNNSRGGISVKGDATSGYLASRLYVAKASPTDSGRYACWYGNYTSAFVTVHVIAGENSAAMQHDSLPEAGTTGGSSPLSHISSLWLLALLALSSSLVLSCNFPLQCYSARATGGTKRHPSSSGRDAYISSR
ncbi:obscurin-like [Penaeus japonicus]|uniref:obscurin-like n=2 Tax=Penaeus japonicus TaxID=27405 RepID=UPI001C70F6EB|nr:obscurin-like [Penaeus japonicus]